jgi:hypothetical protein
MWEVDISQALERIEFRMGVRKPTKEDKNDRRYQRSSSPPNTRHPGGKSRKHPKCLSLPHIYQPSRLAKCLSATTMK